MSNSKKLELKAHCTEMLTSQGMNEDCASMWKRLSLGWKT